MPPILLNERRQRLLRRSLLVLFVLFFLVVVVFFSESILPFVLALFIAYVFAPLVTWLTAPERRVQLPRWGAVLTLYGAFFSIVGLFAVFALPQLAYEVATLPNTAATAISDMQDDLQQSWLPALKEKLRAYVPTNSEPSSQSQPVVTETEIPSRPTLRLRTGPNGASELDLSGFRLEVDTAEEGKLMLRAVAPSTGDDSSTDPVDSVIGGLQKAVQSAPEHLGTLVGHLLGFIQRLLGGIVSALVNIVLMFMIAAFLLIDLEKIYQFVRSLFPKAQHENFDKLVTQMDRGLSGVVRGQFMICLLNGVLSGIGFFLFGVKFAFILAVFAGAMSLIPIFGSLLSSIPAIAIAIAQGSSSPDDYSGIVRALLVLGWLIVIHFFEANFFNPKIIGTSAKIHPVLVVLVLVIGEHSFGLVGALLAVPFFSLLQSVFLFVRTLAEEEEEKVMEESESLES